MADEYYESDVESVSDSGSETSENMDKVLNKKIKNIKKEEEDDDIEEIEEEEEEDEDEDLDEFDEELKEEEDELEESQIVQTNFPNLDSDEEEEEEEEDDENYLQKFGEDIQKKIIQEHHPELQAHNNEEIDALSNVVRDANGIIIDPFHRTIPIVSRYEKARVLGERAKQLNSGAEPFIEIDDTMIDGYVIALKEFEEKKIPFIIQRPLPNGACEYWKLRDLEIL
jgi:DNA-directed RNA polymerase subunit K/omega